MLLELTTTMGAQPRGRKRGSGNRLTSGEHLGEHCVTAKLTSQEIQRRLESAGYVLEQRVGDAFRKAGWLVRQGAFYTDPVEPKLREIDLYAALSHGNGGRCVLAIECKRSLHPWVLLASPGASVGGPEWTEAHVIAAGDLTAAIVRELDRHALFAVPAWIGHNLVVVPEKEKGEQEKEARLAPYRALGEAVAAALAEARVNKSGIEAGVEPTLDLIFPVVIVDAALFRHTVAGDVEQVRGGKLLWRANDTGFPVVVQVVSAEGIETFAESMATAAREILAPVNPLLGDVIERMQHKGDRVGLEDILGGVSTSRRRSPWSI